MKKALLAVLLGSLVALGATAARSAKWVCQETGKTIAKCCCVEKEGKLLCTLTGRKLESCCCKPASN